MPETLRPFRLRRQLEQSCPHLRADLSTKHCVIVFSNFEFDDHPVATKRCGPKLAQQNGLANTPKASDDHRLFCTSPCEAVQEQVERRELVVASYYSLGLSSGVGRVGIGQCSHVRILQVLQDLMRFP
jgi:hypothetical protein